ncbi:hypothetical protein SAMN05428642_101506 [Flaviramulus basaltis]|uniref:PEP-CTERM protein-sorting domain-containing protein n=1 Tax=Flaviramulus basaltis TaxID=369401 RepID=A0A1K2IB97_9FLAO|nr:hypothetical protein [Flaviramulus basaltis]SFZ89692.1 hypothetical protein SAMN05428642_101506 [Flaviramulus basaltis]
MKTRKITLFKSINLIALTLFLVFSVNANAINLDTNLITSTTKISSTNLKTAPAQLILSSMSFWDWLVSLFNKEKFRDNHNPNSGNEGNPNSVGGDSIPLDGGLTILLLGATAFGVKKLRDSKNEIKSFKSL